MNIVKELRKGAGMQQKELALAIGVSVPIISEWEHQKKDPSGERLKKLSEVFGVQPAEILGSGAMKAGGITDEDVKFVLFNGAKGITDEDYEDVKMYAAFLAARRKA